MEEKQLLEIRGDIERIVYKNDKNGYTVLELSVENELVTAVGNMPGVGVGEQVRLIGVWKNHPSFGLQFAAECCEHLMPTTTIAMLKYLSSGSIKGIGPATATKLVETFGERTLEIIQNEPDRLCIIKGITKSKAQSIADEFKNIFGIKEVMLYLGKYGITPQESLKAWKMLGQKTIEIINIDPYRLCDDNIGISFEQADNIAACLDKPQDNICRIRAGIIYILLHNMNNGHTCLPKDKLLSAAEQFLGVEYDVVEEALTQLKNDGSLETDVIDENEFIFTPKMHRCEIYTAGRLLMMLRYPAQSIKGIDKYISSIESEKGIEYADLQKKAIKDALDKGILILTGGPGTGKTTTLNAIIKILEIKGEKVFLAAPTGRAAQRMSEVTGKDARTIHRLLEVEWDREDKPTFKKNEKNLLECDALILDELSMVDANVFEGVLRALPLGCRLIMVGDSDQLPSVGSGNILSDLISSDVIPKVELKEIFRQSMKSLIVTNAHRIVGGQMPELSARNNDFFFLNSNDKSKISETIIDLCANRLPRSYGYSPLFDIQVLCPGRKGELGTIELNKKLQNKLNPASRDKKEITINGSLFRECDKVMQRKNNYDIPWVKTDLTSGEGVFNGDVGILTEINKSASSLTVQFDDRTAMYDIDDAVDLELAYAITVHKSQGSEFEAVIMPMFQGPPQLYYRNLLYTGVTRAKSMIVMVGTTSTVYKMVENNRKTKRYSGLKYFLTRECSEVEK